jgi:hypothetical protein
MLNTLIENSLNLFSNYDLPAFLEVNLAAFISVKGFDVLLEK